MLEFPACKATLETPLTTRKSSVDSLPFISTGYEWRFLCWSTQWHQKFHLYYVQVDLTFWQVFYRTYGQQCISVYCFLKGDLFLSKTFPNLAFSPVFVWVDNDYCHFFIIFIAEIFSLTTLCFVKLLSFKSNFLRGKFTNCAPFFVLQGVKM